ncbi:hypothetical protein OG311_25380 [Streptomyces sp. NBC_01343]|uniref:hypothetical protein n=1 Tax=Streptomyces sp. NBC_01343 TaxID=2903832 RepID=UPI002E13FB8D|nr:hypothetical protein OG311_25380 [Streptomyces sp. NBC_01343]
MRVQLSVLGADPAEHLLRTTGLPLAAVARRVGYESPGALRALLRRRLGKGPRALRPAGPPDPGAGPGGVP